MAAALAHSSGMIPSMVGVPPSTSYENGSGGNSSTTAGHGSVNDGSRTSRNALQGDLKSDAASAQSQNRKLQLSDFKKVRTLGTGERDIALAFFVFAFLICMRLAVSTPRQHASKEWSPSLSLSLPHPTNMLPTASQERLPESALSDHRTRRTKRSATRSLRSRYCASPRWSSSSRSIMCATSAPSSPTCRGSRL